MTFWREAEFITRLAFICGGILTIGTLAALIAMIWSDMACGHKCHQPPGLNPWVKACPVCGCANVNYDPKAEIPEPFWRNPRKIEL